MTTIVEYWPEDYPPAATQLECIMQWASEVGRTDVRDKATECVGHEPRGVKVPEGQAPEEKPHRGDPRPPNRNEFGTSFCTEYHKYKVESAWLHAYNARGNPGSIEWAFCIEDLDHGGANCS